MWQLVSKRQKMEAVRSAKGLACNWHSVTSTIFYELRHCRAHLLMAGICCTRAWGWEVLLLPSL